ncbi:hypothetical protein J6590_071130 [Homalodisca vitripennis]|nr:hypothetical protein J6590_071130 [Homalodisca vitripennis]
MVNRRFGQFGHTVPNTVLTQFADSYPRDGEPEIRPVRAHKFPTRLQIVTLEMGTGDSASSGTQVPNTVLTQFADSYPRDGEPEIRPVRAHKFPTRYLRSLQIVTLEMVNRRFGQFGHTSSQHGTYAVCR